MRKWLFSKREIHHSSKKPKLFFHSYFISCSQTFLPFLASSSEKKSVVPFDTLKSSLINHLVASNSPSLQLSYNLRSRLPLNYNSNEKVKKCSEWNLFFSRKNNFSDDSNRFSFQLIEIGDNEKELSKREKFQLLKEIKTLLQNQSHSQFL